MAARRGRPRRRGCEGAPARGELRAVRGERAARAPRGGERGGGGARPPPLPSPAGASWPPDFPRPPGEMRPPLGLLAGNTRGGPCRAEGAAAGQAELGAERTRAVPPPAAPRALQCEQACGGAAERAGSGTGLRPGRGHGGCGPLSRAPVRQRHAGQRARMWRGRAHRRPSNSGLCRPWAHGRPGASPGRHLAAGPRSTRQLAAAQAMHGAQPGPPGRPPRGAGRRPGRAASASLPRWLPGRAACPGAGSFRATTELPLLRQLGVWGS